MKKEYKKPILAAHKIESIGVVCASAKGLKFTTESNAGDWADSRAWGGTLFDEDASSPYDDEW